MDTAIIIPIITLFVWSVRDFWIEDKRKIPIFAVCLGIILTYLAYAGIHNSFLLDTTTFVECLFAGITNGFSAVGLWEGKKALLPKTKSNG